MIKRRTTITISSRMHDKLGRMKVRYGMTSYEEVIEMLMEKYEELVRVNDLISSLKKSSLKK
jgi:predicted CopG family antitoxin